MTSRRRTRKFALTTRRNVLQVKPWNRRWGSPVRSMRWHPLIWERLFGLQAAHHHQVKVNRVAQVAVEWGLDFLGTLSLELQARILGVRGAKPLTLEEAEALRKELNTKLGSLAGKFRYDDRLAFALPRSMKQVIREEAEGAGTTMSDIARKRITLERPGRKAELGSKRLPAFR
jgi:hypothetical protein